MIYHNKFVGKLSDKDIYYIEKMINKKRSYNYISEKTAFYSPQLDIRPGSILDGIYLVEATMEKTKKYNMNSSFEDNSEYEKFI